MYKPAVMFQCILIMTYLQIETYINISQDMIDFDLLKSIGTIFRFGFGFMVRYFFNKFVVKMIAL